MNDYDWPYKQEDVWEVEDAADAVARLLAGPGAPHKVRAIGELTLANLIYDAMVALRERMIAREGF